MCVCVGGGGALRVCSPVGYGCAVLQFCVLLGAHFCCYTLSCLATCVTLSGRRTLYVCDGCCGGGGTWCRSSVGFGGFGSCMKPLPGPVHTACHILALWGWHAVRLALNNNNCWSLLQRTGHQLTSLTGLMVMVVMTVMMNVGQNFAIGLRLQVSQPSPAWCCGSRCWCRSPHLPGVAARAALRPCLLPLLPP